MNDNAYQLNMDAPNTRALVKRYAVESRRVRNEGSAKLSQRYGDDPREILEIFLPHGASDLLSPCVIFVHGGWWKLGCPQDRAFLAPPYMERGIAFVNVGYPLAPEASLRDIFRSVKGALEWLTENGAACGLDMERVVLAGNSAGGHLAAMLGSEMCLDSLGIHSRNIKGLCLLSGVFDLEPLRDSFANEWLQLDDGIIRDLSPVNFLPPKDTPVFIGTGELEPLGFFFQSRLFARELNDAGHRVVKATVADKDHFEIIEEIGTPGSIPFEFNVENLREEKI